MDRQEVQDKVVEIIRKEKTLPEGDVGVETPLSEVGIDSLDALNILFAIEESFGISIPDTRASAVPMCTVRSPLWFSSLE